jgi:hypothetical protein
LTDRNAHNPAGPDAPHNGGGSGRTLPDADGFVERVVRYLAGALPAQAVDALNTELRDNPAKREVFVRLCLLESRLGEKLAPGQREFAEDALLSDVPDDTATGRDAKMTTWRAAALSMAELDAAADEPESLAVPSISKPQPAPRKWWQRRTTWAAAAVLLAVGVWGVARLMFAPAPLVAMLSASHDVSWDMDRAPPAVGGSLAAGTELRIRRGLLRLTFRDGAEVVIQGPARFTPESQGRMTISTGRMTALVPPAAKGFTVRTPTAEVVDLGTEFGIDATGGAAAPAEVVVFEGHVTLQPSAKKSGEPSRVLSAGAAATIDAAGTVTSVPVNAAAYVRVAEIDAMERAARGSAYDRWIAYRYELARDRDCVAYYAFDQENKSTSPGRLVNRSVLGPQLDGVLAGDADVRPTWTAGRFAQKPALQFGESGSPRVMIPDGAGALDFAGGKGSGQSLAFTIAAWIKARPNPAPGSCIVGRGMLGEMQFGLFTESSFYRARVSGSGGEKVEWYDANSRNYPSAFWHHAVMTYDPAAKSICIYVDGALVETKPAPPVLSRTSGPVLIGCRVDRDGRYFTPVRGAIDELVVLRRAMTAAEVKRMFDAGTPGDTGQPVQ